MVDPDGKTWSYAYDTYGNRASVADPLSDKTTYAYNADGWMTPSVSPNSNVPHCNCASQYTTTYVHDTIGNLTTVTDPLSHQTTRHYDADQYMDWFQDGDGNKTTYVYDLANQQTQIQRPDSTTLTKDYNPDGTGAGPEGRQEQRPPQLWVRSSGARPLGSDTWLRFYERPGDPARAKLRISPFGNWGAKTASGGGALGSPAPSLPSADL